MFHHDGLSPEQGRQPFIALHPARAKILLRKGRAKVVCAYPFTIKLTYKVEKLVFGPTRAVLGV